MTDDADDRRAVSAAWRHDLVTRFAPWFEGVGWGYGFECSDGWGRLITDLTERISDVVGGPEGAPDLRVIQVKEKFGGLRYYMHGVPKEHWDAVYDLVRRAGELSFHTCERCGRPGRMRQGGWVRTLCGPCERDYQLGEG
jgi:hypothetical protein